MNRGFPYEEFPTGWFQILWADELDIGTVMPLHYFGTDLVAFRTSEGRAAVFDAYCPHLGAHLGHGGRVEGNDLVCPFHGWHWDCDGKNTCIPYFDRVNQKQRVRTWHVRDQMGAIWIWHDSLGRAPLWECPSVPECADTVTYYPMRPSCTKMWPSLRIHPQFIVENSADVTHFPMIHHSKGATVIEEYGSEGSIFRLREVITYGGEEGKTWLTPEGNIAGTLLAELHGLGLGTAWFTMPDGFRWLHWQAQTPIDSEQSTLWTGVLVPRETGDDGTAPPDGFSNKILRNQFRQVENDFVIWLNMRYVQRPPLVPEEARPLLALRKWARQFYPSAGEGEFGDRQEEDSFVD